MISSSHTTWRIIRSMLGRGKLECRDKIIYFALYQSHFLSLAIASGFFSKDFPVVLSWISQICIQWRQSWITQLTWFSTVMVLGFLRLAFAELAFLPPFGLHVEKGMISSSLAIFKCVYTNCCRCWTNMLWIMWVLLPATPTLWISIIFWTSFLQKWRACKLVLS